jgi:D-amino-acid dehydrogenase
MTGNGAAPVTLDGPVVVIGGGLVGLSCAWFLHRAGAEVVVLEAGGRTGQGASRGNAGAICPSMAEPIAAPGMVRTALDDMRKPDAALHVHPAMMPRMAGFLLRFTRAGTHAAYARGVEALAQLGRGVVGAYDELAAAGIGTSARHDGYLTLHADEAGAADEHAQIAHMASIGLCHSPGAILGGAELRRIEPLISDRIVAGFQIPGERWIDASLFVDELTAALVADGVEIRTDAGARAMVDLGDGIEVDTPSGTVGGAVAIVAAGAWSRALVAPLGTKLSLYAGKGYSFSVHPERLPDHVLHMPDAHVMCTPYPHGLRLAGTMEFDGTMDRFNPARIDAIVRAARPFLDGVDWAARTQEWVGPRPITPDGLPVLGPLPKHPRVVLATGHQMLGVTLGPVTGLVLSRLLVDGDAGIDLAPFAPTRF